MQAHLTSPHSSRQLSVEAPRLNKWACSQATFLQAIVEILVDTPPPLEELKEDKSDLISLKKEFEELKLLRKQKTTEWESKVCSAKVDQELNSQSGDGMSSPLHSVVDQTKKINWITIH